MKPVLSVENLSLSRGGKTVLSDVSIDVGVGEIVALLGANGAGKSSLVLGAAGAIPTDTGSVAVDGNDVTGSPAYDVRKAGLAAAPEGHKLLSGMTVDENLHVAGAFLAPPEVSKGVDRAYAVFPELADRRSQIAGSLSGGQQQMVVLGQALVSGPKVILADEMSLGLAPLVVKRLLEVVVELADAGIGILLIEQFTHLALGVANRAYVMEQGKVVFSGTPRQIEDDPSILHEAYLSTAG